MTFGTRAVLAYKLSMIRSRTISTIVPRSVALEANVAKKEKKR